MGEIYDWVRNTVIYLILNTIIMNLLGNSSYKKYVSIVSGMILLLIVVSPFFKLLKMDGILDYYLNSNFYRTDMKDYQKELKLMEEKQQQALYGDIKERIKKQVTDMLSEEGLYLYDFDIVMNQDLDSKEFGEITSMIISAGYQEDQGVPVHKINIEKIVISDGIDRENDKPNIPYPQEIHVKNKISDFYNMDQDNINISIQGG